MTVLSRDQLARYNGLSQPYKVKGSLIVESRTLLSLSARFGNSSEAETRSQAVDGIGIPRLATLSRVVARPYHPPDLRAKLERNEKVVSI